jgi:hypothetical protein
MVRVQLMKRREHYEQRRLDAEALAAVAAGIPGAHAVAVPEAKNFSVGLGRMGFTAMGGKGKGKCMFAKAGAGQCGSGSRMYVKPYKPPVLSNGIHVQF